MSCFSLKNGNYNQQDFNAVKGKSFNFLSIYFEIKRHEIRAQNEKKFNVDLSVDIDSATRVEYFFPVRSIISS